MMLLITASACAGFTVFMLIKIYQAVLEVENQILRAVDQKIFSDAMTELESPCKKHKKALPSEPESTPTWPEDCSPADEPFDKAIARVKARQEKKKRRR